MRVDFWQIIGGELLAKYCRMTQDTAQHVGRVKLWYVRRAAVQMT